jgi:hypothetical protein
MVNIDDMIIDLRNWHYQNSAVITLTYAAADEIERLTIENKKLITKCIHLETELLRLERLNNV